MTVDARQTEEEFEEEQDQDEVEDDQEMAEAQFDEIEKLEQMGITATDVAKVRISGSIARNCV